VGFGSIRRRSSSIAAIRDQLSLLPKRPDPFRHDHEADYPCLVCGFDPAAEDVTVSKNPAA
jgi:hypothetical protein